MKSILVPFSGSEASLLALDTALAVARDFKSYIEALFVCQVPPIIAGEGITLPGDYMAQLGEENRVLARKSRESFEAAISARGVAAGDVDASTDTCARWRESEGTLAQAIGEHGRLFDLIVVARDSQPTLDWKAACETALFETGRPVIVAGDNAPERLGRRVVVAWNGSTETARALAVSAPILARAETVVVVTVEGKVVPGPEGGDVARYLARHGLSVTAVTLPAGEDAAGGRVVLNYADEFHADLIIKGAYTHSRLRQMIFGGATNEILNKAAIPVLFCH